VGRFEVLRLLTSLLIGVLSILNNRLAPTNLKPLHLLFARKEFTEVPIIISLHLHVENFSVCHCRVGNQDFVKKVDAFVSDFVKLSLDLKAVPLNQLNVLSAFVFFFVLNSTDSPPSCTPGAH
jgi:hypothetical protein